MSERDLKRIEVLSQVRAGRRTVIAAAALRRYGRVIHLYSPEVLQVRNSIRRDKDI